MKPLRRIVAFGIVALALTAFIAVPQAGADFINLPVKWSQPALDVLDNPVYGPTPNVIQGFDILSNHLFNQVLADDFISDGRPIVAVRWWGSYLSAPTQRPNGFTGPFDISFHCSDANTVPGMCATGLGGVHPTSVPVDPYLVLYETVTAQEEFVGVDEAGDFVYRYDAYLPSPFFEQLGVEYFIDIDKPVPVGIDGCTASGAGCWGWHTTMGSLDFFASAPTHGGLWAPSNFTDLAFELMAAPEPGTLILLGSGLVGLGAWARRRRGKKD